MAIVLGLALLAGAARSARAQVVSGGEIPIPSQWQSGNIVSVWDGSYSDLLAADALAMCWHTQLKRPTDDNGGEQDGVISHLMGLMAGASCYTTCNDPSLTNWQDLFVCNYIQTRADANCNMDAVTHANRALDMSKMRDPYQTSDYVLPAPASLGLSGVTASTVVQYAQREISYAELSLCMAEQLNQKLDTAQVAFASSEDLARVQEMVRERALTAVYEYSAISKTLATASTASTNVNLYGAYLIPLVLWRNTSFNATNAQRLGDDFSEAIDLLVEATENTIAFKLRDPAAQTSFGTPQWSGTSYNGLGGPRADVLEKVLYDGYDATPNTTKRRSVSTDTSAPQVGVLLGLARSANALKLHVNGNPQFVSATNASTLLLTVENFVRNQTCTRQGTPPASCVLATAATAPSSYVVWQKLGINLSHAQALVDALTEGLFGQPTPASRATGQWSYPPLFAAGTTQPSGPAEQLTFHLLGQHQFTGSLTTAYPTGDVVIDPKFVVSPLRASDIQSSRGTIQFPMRDIIPNGDAYTQIGWFRFNPLNTTDVYGYPSDRRQLGSNTVLALARETLLQLSQVTTTAKGIYTEAAPAVTLIEKMIGPRQVMLRQTYTATSAGGSCPNCVNFTPNVTVSGGVTTYQVSADVIEKTADPFVYIAYTPGIPLASTIAGDVNTKTIFGQTQASAITNLTWIAPTPAPYGTTGYKCMTSFGSWTSSSPRGLTVLLRSNASTAYEHAFTGFPSAAVGGAGGPTGTIVTWGGRFEEEINKAWTFDGTRWAVPKYDGFTLPRTWNPAPDASLFGDSAGVTIEQHFLDRATVAADESATALSQAFDTLQQEDLDDASVLSSDQRSKDLTSIEVDSLCGMGHPACLRSYVATAVTVPACSGPANATCEAFRTILGKITALGKPEFSLAQAVVNEIQAANPAPTFDNYRGGTLQGLFVSQWNNWQALQTTMKTSVASVQAAISQTTAAVADVTAANADYAAVNADVTSAYTMLMAQQTQYNAAKAMYDAQVEAARHTMNDIECSDAARQNAEDAGYSWTNNGDDLWLDATHVHNVDAMSWSQGPAMAQITACQNATNAFNLAVATAKPQKDALDALLKVIDAQLNPATQPMGPLAKRLAAAETHKESAYARQAAAYQALEVTDSTATASVQAAVGQILTSIANIDEAYGQSDVANAKTAVEANQVNYDVRARFGLRARFHNYDLWRARALTENARRLALAARRAIESRYVVDLSTMEATEPFVEAPTLWADQVYSSDLKPFAIGLSAGPSMGSGLYAGAVKDYVSNLKLFLDGFAVQRPTATALSDAEVIQIAAPAAQVVSSNYAATFGYIDPTSTGWSFYCPGSDTWITDPDIGKFTTATPTWTLSTACAGSAPTLARYRFELDPWGRPDAWIGNAPYVSRYNVRLRNIALNLVGSGIRSCQKAPDPSACYAEPFIRYDLKHVGPAWVTSYDGAWHALDIPKAVIEAGKALATEEWLDPVSNGFNRPDVSNVARQEFVSQPIGGAYELTLDLTPDVNVERIQRIQMLAQTDYWVRQQ